MNISKSKIASIVSVLLIGMSLYWAWGYFDLSEYVTTWMEWVKNNGALGVTGFVLLYVLLPMAFFPVTILTLSAGAIYGFWFGLALVSFASTLSATVQFLIARYVFSTKVKHYVEEKKQLKALCLVLETHSKKTIAMSRVSPVLPFAPLNYFYGISPVRLRDYVLITWLAMIPGTMVYVNMGRVMGSISQWGSGTENGSWQQWGLTILGIIATVGLLIFLSRVVKRKMEKMMSESEENQTVSSSKATEGQPVCLNGLS